MREGAIERYLLRWAKKIKATLFKKLQARDTNVVVVILVEHAKFLVAFLKFFTGELQTGKIGRICNRKRNKTISSAYRGMRIKGASQIDLTLEIAASRCFPCSASTGMESISVNTNTALATTSNSFMMRSNGTPHITPSQMRTFAEQRMQLAAAWQCKAVQASTARGAFRSGRAAAETVYCFRYFCHLLGVL
jgi:hypothetical protein